MRKAIFSLLALPLFLVTPLAAQVKIAQKPDRVSVEIDGKPFTEFFFGPNAPKPYLHPLRAATGTVVTRGYPMEQIAGESQDHPHHRGLWFAHGDINGVDYWTNEASQQKGIQGKVVLKKVNAAKSGEKTGEIDATIDWINPRGKTVLTETRKMIFHSHPTLRMIDLDIALKAIEKSKFGDTKEGTFSIRVAAGLEEPVKNSLPKPLRTGRMVSSNGKTGESQVWGRPAEWVDYAGELNGEKVGIAIFDHPSNPRHPTHWHSRSYGLFAANIFGEHDFYNDKTRDGSMTLEPGQTLRFRYRVVIHPGDAASAGLAGLYKEYAGK
jgi:Methane oxygenase PmoA